MLYFNSTNGLASQLKIKNEKLKIVRTANPAIHPQYLSFNSQFFIFNRTYFGDVAKISL